MSTACQISAVLLILQWLVGQPSLAAPGAGHHIPSLATPAGSAIEEPLIETAPTSSAEDEALFRAILAYQAQPSLDDFDLFDAFLAEYPGSGWRVALLTNLGVSYCHCGYFSKALAVREQIWQFGRELPEPRIKALAREALWLFNTQPGVSCLCGPMAIKRLLLSQGVPSLIDGVAIESDNGLSGSLRLEFAPGSFR
jgi:hypothetical protein